MRFFAPFVLVAFALTPVSSIAAPTPAAPLETPAADEAAEAKPAKKPRKICRSETATGSVMPKRVCRTVAQMEEDERNAEQFRDRQNRMGASAR